MHLFFMKYRKRLYIPGIISIAGIWLFIFLNKEKFGNEPTRVIQLYVPTFSSDNFYYEFSDEHFEKVIRKKHQILISIDSNEIDNSKKLELIRHEARKIKYTYDTNTVVKVSFTSKTSYNEVVRLLDLCRSDSHKRYVLLNKSLVIFGEYPPKNLKKDEKLINCSLSCGTFFSRVSLPEKSLLKIIRGKISPFSIIELSGLTTLWILMLAISICLKKHKKQTISLPSSIP